MFIWELDAKKVQFGRNLEVSRFTKILINSSCDVLFANET